MSNQKHNNINYIFLDIDGCLTSIKHNTYFNPDSSKYHPEQTIVDSIIKLCKSTNANVIMSSNWRKFDINGVWTNSYGSYKNPLYEVKQMLGKYCIGTLTNIRHITKSQALTLWFDENKIDGSFVIFDDDVREGFQNVYEYGIKDHFILVDNNFGITSNDIAVAKAILDKGNN